MGEMKFNATQREEEEAEAVVELSKKKKNSIRHCG
jgi:hypothetical protein